MTNFEIEKYNYVISSRTDFNKNCMVDGLKARISDTQYKYVLYDPTNDSDGYLLVGNDPQLLNNEAMEFFELPRALINLTLSDVKKLSRIFEGLKTYRKLFNDAGSINDLKAIADANFIYTDKQLEHLEQTFFNDSE
jgi:hypothetical protein